MRKKLIPFSLAVVVIVFGGASWAVEYFPTDPSAAFDYTYGPVTIVDVGSGEIARVVCATCIVGSSNSYRVDASGDIYETQFAGFAQAAPDPSIYLYSPNLLYLDFPLDTGKEWESTSELFFYMGDSAIDTVTLRGRVLGPKTVTVPAGEFDVIEVELDYQYAGESWPSGTQVLWLHRQLGPVNGLQSWTGVVSTEQANWGTLKAGYR